MNLETPRWGWVLLAEPLEALPVDDLKQHWSGMDCPCHPIFNDDDIIEHNSFDGREDFTTGKRQPS